MKPTAQKKIMPHQRKHHNREDLAGEHPFGDQGQLIALCIFLVVWIADSFFLKWTTWVNPFIPWYFRLIMAIPILGLAMYLATKSMNTVFGEVRDPPIVIQTGVYAHSRHPMYLAALLLYLGLFFISFSVVSFGIYLGIWIFYDFIAKYEEKRLLSIYGQNYKEYMKKIPRWWYKF